MTPPARPSERSTIASLDRARFDKLLALVDDGETRLAVVVEKLGDFCRDYSRAHGFRVNLTPEQVRRDMEARG